MPLQRTRDYSREFKDSQEFEELIEKIAAHLEQRMEKNRKKPHEELSPSQDYFVMGAVAKKGSLCRHLKNIIQYFGFEPSHDLSWLAIPLYIDRIEQKAGIQLSPSTAHSMIYLSLILARKYWEGETISGEFFGMDNEMVEQAKTYLKSLKLERDISEDERDSIMKLLLDLPKVKDAEVLAGDLWQESKENQIRHYELQDFKNNKESLISSYRVESRKILENMISALKEAKIQLQKHSHQDEFSQFAIEKLEESKNRLFDDLVERQYEYVHPTILGTELLAIKNFPHRFLEFHKTSYSLGALIKEKLSEPRGIFINNPEFHAVQTLLEALIVDLKRNIQIDYAVKELEAGRIQLGIQAARLVANIKNNILPQIKQPELKNEVRELKQALRKISEKAAKKTDDKDSWYHKIKQKLHFR